MKRLRILIDFLVEERGCDDLNNKCFEYCKVFECIFSWWVCLGSFRMCGVVGLSMLLGVNFWEFKD